MGIVVFLGAGAWYFDVAHECGRHSRFTTIRPTRGFCRSAPWSAHEGLVKLVKAEAEFRGNDADGDGDKNYWRKDIAGLYGLVPIGGNAIKIAPLSLAAADDRPIVDLHDYVVPSTHGGYWYRAIRHADEDPNRLSRYRFAFCAYPDNVSSGKYIYVVDENNTIYRAVANGRRGIDVFPTEEQLKAEWAKLD